MRRWLHNHARGLDSGVRLPVLGELEGTQTALCTDSSFVATEPGSGGWAVGTGTGRGPLRENTCAQLVDSEQRTRPSLPAHLRRGCPPHVVGSATSDFTERKTGPEWQGWGQTGAGLPPRAGAPAAEDEGPRPWVGQILEQRPTG